MTTNQFLILDLEKQTIIIKRNNKILYDIIDKAITLSRGHQFAFTTLHNTIKALTVNYNKFDNMDFQEHSDAEKEIFKGMEINNPDEVIIKPRATSIVFDDEPEPEPEKHKTKNVKQLAKDKDLNERWDKIQANKDKVLAMYHKEVYPESKKTPKEKEQPKEAQKITLKRKTPETYFKLLKEKLPREYILKRIKLINTYKGREYKPVLCTLDKKIANKIKAIYDKDSTIYHIYKQYRLKSINRTLHIIRASK